MDFTLKLPLSLVKQQILASLAEVKDQFRGAIQVIPQGEVDLHGHGSELIGEFPVKIQANGDWLGLTRNVFSGITLPALVKFEVLIQFRTELKILLDWNLQTRSHVSFSWLQSPSLNLGLKLPLKEVIRPMLERELEKLGKDMDKWIPKAADLRASVEEGWRHTQDIIPLEDNLNLKLIPELQPVPISPIRIEGPDLSVSAQIPLRGEVGPPGFYLPKAPQPLTDPIELIPDLPSTLPVNLHLSWESLEHEISDQSIEEHIAGTELDISWRQVSLSGEGKHVEVSTWFRVTGSRFWVKRGLSGKIVLSWEWDLHPGDEQINIKHLQARITQAPAWLRASWALVRYWVKKDLTRGLSDMIEEQIRASRKEVEEQIAAYALPTGATLNGRIHKIMFQEIYAEERGLCISLSLQGRAQMTLTSL